MIVGVLQNKETLVGMTSLTKRYAELAYVYLFWVAARAAAGKYALYRS
jgi:hypothetical protein